MNKIFVGDNWRVLTESLAEEIDRSRSDKLLQPCSIIVPSQAAKVWVLKQLARLLENDLVGVGVYSLHQFALDAFLKLNRLPPEVTEDKRYIALVWQLIQGESSGFHYPKRDPYATVRALYSLIRDLRDAAVEEEELSWLIGPEPYEGLNVLEVKKAQRVFSFYAHYLKALTREGWTDSPGMMRLATELLEQITNHKSQITNIFIWGFSDFVGTQKNFLKELAKGSQVNFFIPEGEFTKPLIDELSGWGLRKVSVSAQITNHKSQITNLFCAPTRALEAWAIARKIINLHETEGVAYEDCGVVFRNPKDFDFLKRAFLEAEVPHISFEDPTENLLNKPLGQAISAALEFLGKPSAKRLVELIALSAAKPEPALKGYIALALARVLSLNRERIFALSASRELDGVILKVVHQEPGIPKALVQKVNQEVAYFVNVYIEAFQFLDKPDTKGLARWLAKLLVLPKDERIKKAYQSFKELLGNIPPEVFSSRHFTVNLLLESLSSIHLDHEHAPEAMSGVWIVAANAARGAHLPCVFIFGANDGNYPWQISEDPFLSDALRERLNKLGYSLRQSVKTGVEDALLFKLLTRSAERKLFISYSQIDSEGKPMMASPYLDQAADIELISSLREDKVNFLNKFCPQRKPEVSNTKTADVVVSPGPVPSVTSVAEWKAWLTKSNRLSPTLLADFVSCPQAFFYKRFKKLEGDLGDARYELLSAPWLGGAFSKVVVDFLAAESNDFLSLWNNHLRKEWPQIEIAHLAAAERYKMRRIELTLRALEKQLVELKAGGRLLNARAEEELKFKLSSLAYPLEARVDARADTTYLEFKLTGSSVFKGTQGTRLKPSKMLNKLLNPGASEGARYGLQILFYLAYARQFGDSGNVLLINPYWEISSRGKSPMVYSWSTTDEMDDLMENLKSWTKLLIEGISIDHRDAVVFPFWPHEGRGERCQWCPYQTLCLKNVASARLANEPLLIPLIQDEE